jgi:hypothetical protein
LETDSPPPVKRFRKAAIRVQSRGITRHSKPWTLPVSTIAESIQKYVLSFDFPFFSFG